MKIGKITLDGFHNYGNVLQSYALEKILYEYADEVDSLWHSPDKFCVSNWQWGWKEYVKTIINWKHFNQKMHDPVFLWEMIRQTNIKKFCQKYLHLRDIYQTVDCLDSEYDFFVTGSDQVWNPYWSQSNHWNEFLKFASPKKRIAYAASFGVSEIPLAMQEKFSENLKEMQYISVREEQAAKMIKLLTGREVPVLLDPTLVLGADEWEKIEVQPSWYKTNLNEKYILTYFLGEKPIFLHKFAEENNLRLIHLLDKKYFDWYITSPEEFLYLIHHAALVYTDSFHGAVFSILYRRPFIVCDRVQYGACNMSSRIDTLLKLFNLSSRRGTSINKYGITLSIDMKYPDINLILENERRRSRAFLEQALGVNR